MEKETTCSFTGHRIIEEKDQKLLQKALKKEIKKQIENGIVNFCSGGAIGFDTLVAQTVLYYKKKFPHIRLCMVLPCKNQGKFWTLEQKETYERILLASDEVIYTADTYYKGCMQKRNRYLVDCAGCVVAYLTKDSGGTKYTVNYAEKQGVSVTLVGPAATKQLSLFS